jgi:toxin ParE1/3/4
VAILRWAEEAAADLQAIHDFIARDSDRYARAVCAELVEAVDQLGQFPQSGRVVPELRREDIREILRGSYRIVYRLRSADVVEIVTIVHGARLLRLEGSPPDA